MMIVCEGVDLAGKSSHSRWLAEHLGYKLQRFPDDSTETGKVIRSWLNGAWCAHVGSTAVEAGISYGHLNALVFQALQIVNRMEKWRELDHEDLVLDRYWASGVVYGAQDGLDEDWLIKVHDPFPPADLNILFDVDVETVRARSKERGTADRYEDGDWDAVRQRIARYHRLWERGVRRDGRDDWCVIDARGTVEQTRDQITRILRARGIHPINRAERS